MSKKKETVKDIEQKISVLQKRKTEMMEIHWKNVEFPKLKKKYVGKFFRYHNGYNSMDKWFLYFQVLEVTNDSGRFLRVNSFQTDSNGKIEIELGHLMTGSCIGVEITKKAFEKAYIELSDRLMKF